MALAYTTLDGLLAVFLYNISYIVKHETSSNIQTLKISSKQELAI